ncbi:MAG: hypothetical protein NUV34_09625, partial [Sulfuricaulis sp.]|nr:hypothetical protein [Sulfuricaulis sp.]
MAMAVSTGWTFVPLPGQAAFLADNQHRYVCLEAGLAAGKTFAGGHKLLARHVANSIGADGQLTGCASGIIADTYLNLHRFCIPALSEACRMAGITMVMRTGLQEIHLPQFSTATATSRIYLWSADRADRISGVSVGALWGDEAARWRVRRSGDPKDDPLLQARGRLRDNRARLQQFIFTYTNEGDGTPIYQFMRE